MSANASSSQSTAIPSTTRTSKLFEFSSTSIHFWKKKSPLNSLQQVFRKEVNKKENSNMSTKFEVDTPNSQIYATSDIPQASTSSTQGFSNFNTQAIIITVFSNGIEAQPRHRSHSYKSQHKLSTQPWTRGLSLQGLHATTSSYIHPYEYYGHNLLNESLEG
uniref:Uncharacterized protein n=1 Tax=Ditylenchus dipsaci TaxID=166011 RepID=A0A915DXJ2_9BILA